jgi:exodeoxyribonuclease VII small subunit
MPAKKKNSEKAAENFEEALKRLGQITTELEGGDLSLEKTISHYEEGISLLRYCRATLNDIENRIKILEENEDGSPITKNFFFPKNNDPSSNENPETDTSDDNLCEYEDAPEDTPPTNQGGQFLL